MKNTLLFGLIALLTTPIFAQKPIIKTERIGNGDRKNIYTIIKNDTVEVKQYFENGLLYLHIHKDTLWHYNWQGVCNLYIVADKICYTHKAKTEDEYELENITTENIKIKKQYFPDGDYIFTTVKGDTMIEEIYNNKRSIIESYYTIKDNDKQNIIIYDTLNNKIGQGYYIEDKINKGVFDAYYEHKYNIKQDTFTDINNAYYRLKILNQDTITYYENNLFSIVKDNINCTYSIINIQDSNTVVTAYYDYITKLLASPHHFIVQKNGKYGVIDINNKIILPIAYEYLKELDDKSLEPFIFHSKTTKKDSLYLAYQENGKRGVMTLSGKKLIPPQYDDINFVDKDYYSVKIGNKSAAIDKENNIILNPIYDAIDKLTFDKYFVVANYKIENKDTKDEFKITQYGLVYNNKEILEPKYRLIDALKYQNAENPAWEIYSPIYKYNYDINSCNNNMYYLDKGFLIDSSKITKIFYIRLNNLPYYVIKEYSDEDKEKYHILNANTGEYLFKDLEKYTELEDYLDLKILSSWEKPEEKKTYYLHLRKSGKEGIFDLISQKWIFPLQYDTIVLFKREKLEPFIFNTDEEFYPIKEARYIVKKDNKYYITDDKGKQIDTMQYDEFYMYHLLSNRDIYQNYNKSIALFIKGNKYYFITHYSFPNHLPHKYYTTDNKRLKIEKIEIPNNNYDYPKGILINNKGDVLLRPHQQIIDVNEKEATVKDTISNIYYVIKPDGSYSEKLSKGLKQLSKQYKILEYSEKSNLILLQDNKTKLFGLADMTGKILQPCSFYAASEIDTVNGIIWLKKNANSREDDSIYRASLKFQSDYNPLRKDVLLFNNKGKQASHYAFDEPISFYFSKTEIGFVNGKEGVFNSEGQTIIAPQQYDAISIEPDIIYIGKEWENNSTYIWGFTDIEGNIIVEPRWTHFSRFYGKYAIFLTNGVINLMNKKGELLLPPVLGINNYADSINILDSLMLSNAEHTGILEALAGNYNDMHAEYNLNFEPPMSIKTYVQLKNKTSEDKRRFMMNKILEMTVRQYFIRPNQISKGSKILLDFWFSDSTVSMNIGKKYEVDEYIITYKKENNKWQEKKIGDFLLINNDNYNKINQLIINEIGKLKGVNIDCSEPHKHLENVKNNFFVTNEGISFVFTFATTTSDYTLVTLTWDMLRPYLR